MNLFYCVNNNKKSRNAISRYINSNTNTNTSSTKQYVPLPIPNTNTTVYTCTTAMNTGPNESCHESSQVDRVHYPYQDLPVPVGVVQQGAE
mmetsp:Transcript_11313/g.12142  ORF Transcript_11313/g.12142 Transcript_11313/m.12142 type:complete len:91 (+) Transcript_11313:61-333(+)